MLVPWTEQESTERVFLLQHLKPNFPLNLMPQSSPASPTQCCTISQFCDGSSLPLPCAQQSQQALRALPWGTSGTLSWDFAVQSVSPVLWSGTLMLSRNPGEQWPHSLLWLSTKKLSFRPLDFNQTCTWKCLMAVFKFFLHNPHRQDVTCVNANEI